MLERASEALDAALAEGDRRTTGWSLMYVLTALELGPTPLSEALERADRYAEAFEGERAIQASIIGERTWINAWLGRGDAARSDLIASRAIDEKLGRRWSMPSWLVADAAIAWLDGGPAEAERPLREGFRALGDRGDAVNVEFFAPLLARVLLELGRDQEAETLLLDFCESRLLPSARIQGSTMAALIAARNGDTSEALRLSAQAVVNAAATDFLVDQADVELDRAEILQLAGRPAEARAAAADALERYERKEYAIGIRRAREMQERLAR